MSNLVHVQNGTHLVAYMMRHVLVAKGLWNIVQGIDVRPVVVVDAANAAAEIGDVEDVTGSSTLVAPVRAPPLTEQICWDGKDAQAHALIALSVKRAIIPHIRSCKIAKDAWDILSTLYQARNEARVAYLRNR